jgi:hypothetical protein
MQDPGVYEILDVEKNVSYYGETSCLLIRFEMHHRQLKNGTHSCGKLLAAYKELKSSDNFRYIVLAHGPEFETYEKRKQLEDQLIAENVHRCFNQTAAERTKYYETRRIVYKGKEYDSVRGSLRDTEHVKICRTTLMRQLKNPKITDVYYTNEPPVLNGSIQILARKGNGPLVLLPSIKAAKTHGFASGIRAAKNYLKSNQNGWRYAIVDETGKGTQGNYTLKEG